MGGKEYHVFPSKKICLTKSKFFVAEPLCFTNFLVSKKFLDKERGDERREGVSRVSVKYFSLTVLKSFVDENLVCCVS